MQISMRARRACYVFVRKLTFGCAASQCAGRVPCSCSPFSRVTRSMPVEKGCHSSKATIPRLNTSTLSSYIAQPCATSACPLNTQQPLCITYLMPNLLQITFRIWLIRQYLTATDSRYRDVVIELWQAWAGCSARVSHLD